MDEWSKKAKELGVSFDDLSASKAAQLNDSLGYLKTAFEGIALTVGSQVAPIIVELVDKAIPKFKVFAEWLGQTLPQVLNVLIGAVQWLIDTAMAAWRVLEDVGAVRLINAALSQLMDTIKGTLIPAWQRLMLIVEDNKPVFEALAQFLGAVVVVSIIAVIAAIDLAVKMIAVWIEWIGAVVTAWVNFKDNLIGVWNDIKTATASTWESIQQTIVSAINAVTAPIDAFIQKVNSVKNTVSQSFSNLGANLGFGGARANGGDVSSGTAYLVGERGPELFVPAMAGAIVPSGMGATTVNVAVNGNISNDMDLGVIATRIGDEIVRKLKMTRRV